MTKLTDTQAAILRAAAEREGHNVLPLPGSLRGGAATKVVDTLVAKGLVEEVDADLRKGEPVWRETGDGHGTTLVATRTGLAAIGIAPESADSAPTGANEAPTEDAATEAAAATKPASKPRTPREGTKQALLRANASSSIDAVPTGLTVSSRRSPRAGTRMVSGSLSSP